MARIPRSVLTGLAALTILRLAIAAVLPLGDDETFYWEWSRHLDAGYIDHPPAIAFLVWVTTHLFGDTPFGVHAPAVLLSFVTSLALWVLAREVLGHETGATWSVILFTIIPVFAAGAVLAAPDAPLGVCWVLTLLWAWRASAEHTRGAAWLAAGVWLGLALDSKYTAAALPVSLGLWLALSPTRRRWLWRPEPYWGLAVALLLFVPVLWWNATHAWASIAFTFIGRLGWFAGGNFPIFLGLQFLYLGPLMFLALTCALVEAARRGLALREDRWLFLAAAGCPVIAGMFVVSLFGHVKGHWPAPAYLTGAVALGGIVTERPWGARSRAWRAGAVAVLASTVLVAALVHALPPLAPYLLPPHLDPTVDYYGWTEAAQEIASVARRDARGPFFVTTDRYQVMAQFDFSTDGRFAATTITGQDQYNVWTRWDTLRGQDGLFIRDGRYPPDVELNEGCQSVEVEPDIRVVRRGVVVRTLGLIWCRNFQGHPIHPLGPSRWAPGPAGPLWRLSRGARPSAGAAAPDPRG